MEQVRPYLLAETNWQALQKERFEVAILPWGATEAHNYHLPYATDVIESEFISAESARIAWEQGSKVIVLPTVPFGVNTGQSDIYLDINLNPTTQLAILDDIVTVLNRQGLKKLMILNSHGGNNFKPLLRELGLRFPEMFICFSNWFQSVDKTQFFDAEGDHADEMETSLMLLFRPELVLPKEQWGSGASKQIKIPALREGWAWAERRWSDISADTGVGNPKAASKEKGIRFFEAITQKMGAFITDLAEADLQDLYEES